MFEAENERLPDVHDVVIGGFQFKIALVMRPDRLVEAWHVHGQTTISSDEKQLSSLPTPCFFNGERNGQED